MTRSLLLAACALAGVAISVAMVLIGLPEANPVQSVLLELSALPLSASVGIGVWMLHQRATRPVGPRSRTVLLAGTGLVSLGLLVIVWAYLAGPREVVHAGQALIWLGVFAALLVMVRRQPRERASRFRLVPQSRDPEAADAARAESSEPSL